MVKRGRRNRNWLGNYLPAAVSLAKTAGYAVSQNYPQMAFSGAMAAKGIYDAIGSKRRNSAPGNYAKYLKTSSWRKNLTQDSGVASETSPSMSPYRNATHRTEGHSKFTYKGRRDFHKSKYEKTNCAHGMVVDHHTEGFHTGVAGQDYRVLGVDSGSLVGMNTYFQMKDLTNMFQDRLSAAAGTNLRISSAPSGSGNVTEKLRKVMSYSRTYQIVNVNTHRAKITLYDLIAKETFPYLKSGTTPTSGFPTFMINYDKDMSAPNSAYWPAFKLEPTDPDFNLLRMHQFRKAWGICKITNVWLEPGECHIHRVFHRCNFVLDDAKMKSMGLGTNDALSSLPDYFLKGVTTCTLMFSKGGVVHWKDKIGEQTDKDVTLDGVRIDHVTQFRSYVREVTPLKDFFIYQKNISWPHDEDVGATINDLRTVEEETPAEIPGNAP